MGRRISRIQIGRRKEKTWVSLGMLHDNAARVLFLGLERRKQVSKTESRDSGWLCTKAKKAYLGIEHLALSTEAITLCNKIVNLLTTLQDTLDGLVQDNLCLVQLLLDLHDAVGGVRVLVLDNVLFESRERQLGVGVGKGRARVARQELVEDLGQQLVGDEGGVFLVGDDDGGDTLAAAVGVEGVGLLFDVLSLARLGAFGDRLCEERHELADTGAGEAGVAAQVAFGAQLDGRLVFILEDLWNRQCCV